VRLRKIKKFFRVWKRAWNHAKTVHHYFHWKVLWSYPFGIGFVVKMVTIFKLEYHPTLEDEVMNAMAKSMALKMDEEIMKEFGK